MNRRSLLRSGAASVPFGLAGCSNINESGDDSGGDTSSTETTNAEPATVGELRELDEQFAVSVDDITLQETVLHPSDEDDDAHLSVFRSGYDSVLAIVTVSAKNNGTSELALDDETFELEQGTWYEVRDDIPTSIHGFEGERFDAGAVPDVQPGETTTGYYLAKVSRADARKTLTVNASREGEETELSWKLPPEEDSERTLPKVRAESVSVPEAPMTGLEYDIELTVTNDGDADGMFRGLLQWQRNGRWTRLERAASAVDADTPFATEGTIREPIPAGQTKTVTVPCVARYPQILKFRVKSTDVTWQTEFQPATLTIGDQIVVDQETVLSVQQFRTPDKLTILEEDNDTGVEVPDEDRYFVAVRCKWRRMAADRSSESPGQGDFTFSTPNVDDVGERWRPDRGEEVNESWHSSVERSLEKHTEVTGWYIWSVNIDFRKQDLRVSYEGDEPDETDLSPLLANWNHN